MRLCRWIRFALAEVWRMRASNCCPLCNQQDFEPHLFCRGCGYAVKSSQDKS